MNIDTYIDIYIFMYGVRVSLSPFRTAVPFWGTGDLEFEWFAPKMGLQS